MIRKYGNCINYKNCKNADEKIEIGVPEGNDFVCPECSNTLYVLKPQAESKGKTLKIILGVVALIGLFLLIKNSFDNSKGSEEKLSVIDKPNAENKNDDYFKIIQNGKVNIGVQALSAPLNYIENGKQKGLDYDLARLIFSQTEFGFTNNTSIEADHLVKDYADIPSLLSKKTTRGNFEVDIIMGGLTFTDDDDPNVVYTIPYMEDFGYCLVAKKSSTIKSLDDLKGKKIGVVQEDPDVLSYTKSVLPAGATIVELSDDTETWLSNFLNTNKVDAIFYDFPFAVGEIEGSDLQIKVANLPNSSISYKIGLRKGNEKLRDELNTAIRKIKELPEYSTLIKRYLPVKDVLVPTNDNKNPIHIVKKGESLSIIAEQHLNNVKRWKDIQSLNNLPNPQFISTGDKLIMPVDYR